MSIDNCKVRELVEKLWRLVGEIHGDLQIHRSRTVKAGQWERISNLYRWAWEEQQKLRPMPGTCRYCGCTEDEACEGGCYWMDAKKTACSNPDCIAKWTIKKKNSKSRKEAAR